MRVAYMDAFAGASGDMVVGALIHLGAPLAALEEELGKLAIGGYRLGARRERVCGLAATRFAVELTATTGRHGRAFPQVRDLVARSGLSPLVRERALAVLARLGEAEARAHGTSLEEVHLHEVGALDSIIDIVATAAALNHLGVEAIYASALPLGSGLTRGAHGPLPVPAPAVVELLKGRRVRLEDGAGEMVTPTGAAIIAALAEPGPPPELAITGVGYGVGTRSWPDRPNLLRVLIGEPVAEPGLEEVVVIEAQVDDMNPELYTHVVERLLAAGALDVTLSPLEMKKGRPGTLLRVLAPPAKRERLAGIVFTETTTIGLRWSRWQRLVLPREERRVETAYGTVAIKVVRTPDGREHGAPEYEDCRRIALARGVPLRVVYEAALAAFLRHAG